MRALAVEISTRRALSLMAYGGDARKDNNSTDLVLDFESCDLAAKIYSQAV